MEVLFNEKVYRKNGRLGKALKNLCFDIFKYYLELNKGLTYEQLQETFNKWHCNNNSVVLSKYDWENKTEDLKKRYFNPINYNNQTLYFTTQWGNNGGDCDNINNMIDFAKSQDYNIGILGQLELKFDKNETNRNMNIKNIMLYGAPGVGKTYNYKRIITMIENGHSESEIFKTIKNNDDNFKDEDIYENIKKDKRIEFVTFHQSYSYEDFIEGFRPNENGDIELDKKGGVFKRIADKARENLEESQKENTQIKEEITFKQKLDSFIEKLEIEIEKKGYYEITEAAYISSIDSDAFRYNIRRENPTYKYDLRMKFEDLFEFEKNNVSSRQDVKKLETINSLANQHATYYFKVFNKIIGEVSKVHGSEININKEELKNFYIVIDEINRGNISKIFGELITLIEEDKRDTYEVTLPYSKKKFKIPSNLYIIATMNSTDKSIATIDIALRRRFTFLKMTPKPELVKDKNAQNLMVKLNDFIKDTIGEDYMLGHAYFMNDLDLEFIREYKIKPLLEEYFYGDEENFTKAIEILEDEKYLWENKKALSKEAYDEFSKIEEVVEELGEQSV